MKKIDANVVLRYVLNDDHKLSSKAREIIDQNIVEVPIEVLCEVVYVLAGYYKIDKKDISKELKHFFDRTQCVIFHREAVLRGLEYFGEKSFDFVDCVLAGYAEVEKDEIFSFDNKLKKLLQKG